MYYMQQATTSTELKWSPKGLLGLLRAALPRESGPATEAVAQDDLHLTRMSHDRMDELAQSWRIRAGQGDLSAHAVADAFESVARRRRAENSARNRVLRAIRR